MYNKFDTIHGVTGGTFLTLPSALTSKKILASPKCIPFIYLTYTEYSLNLYQYKLKIKYE